MSEVFSAIKIEGYLSGGWVDLTPDVRHSPPWRVNGLGITGNTVRDRTGDAGRFTFSLDNSTSNSGGLNGYYTPQGANTRSGWQPNIPVRLYFEYDGYRVYKFYGFIDHDGIQPAPFPYSNRDVVVTASNWMKYAAEQKVANLYRQTNYNIFNAVQDVVDRCTRKPLNVVMRGVPFVTLPTVFDNTRSDTKASAEFEKLAFSEFGSIYVAGDQTGGETLYVEAKEWFKSLIGAVLDSEDIGGQWLPVKSSSITDDFLLEDGTSFLLLENGDNLLLENRQRADFTDADIKRDAMRVGFGKTYYSRVKFQTYPRTVDSSVVILSALDDPILIEASETLTDIRNQYRDPNNPEAEVSGFAFVAPVATTDYQMFQNEDGTGTDYTANLTITAEAGSGEVVYTALTNTAGTEAYITKLNQRGKGVYIYDTIDKVYQVSPADFGDVPLDINCPYLAGITDLFTNVPKTFSGIYGDLLLGSDLGELTIESISFDVNRSSKLMFAFMFCEPGTYLKLNETMTATLAGGTSRSTYGKAWRVVGYDLEVVNGMHVRWSPVLKWYFRY